MLPRESLIYESIPHVSLARGNMVKCILHDGNWRSSREGTQEGVRRVTALSQLIASQCRTRRGLGHTVRLHLSLFVLHGLLFSTDTKAVKRNL